jgi:hypothetical protein
MFVFVTVKQKESDHTLTINTKRASERLELYFETENIPGEFPSMVKAMNLI